MYNAVIRCLTVMGEASNKVSEETKSRFPDFPWKGIRTMRNRVVHHYYDIDVSIVWKTIIEDLPEAKEKLDKMKKDLDDLNLLRDPAGQYIRLRRRRRNKFLTARRSIAVDLTSL